MEQIGHVYIIHAPRDDDMATRVHQTLADAGIQTWLDHVHGKNGDVWAEQSEQINSAVQKASSGLVLLSNAAINSPTVAAEYRTFLAQNKALYVALLEPLLPELIPYRLRTISPVNLATDFETGMDALIQVMKSRPVWAVNTELPARRKRKVTLRLPPDQLNADELSKLVTNLVEAGVDDIEVIEVDDAG